MLEAGLLYCGLAGLLAAASLLLRPGAIATRHAPWVDKVLLHLGVGGTLALLMPAVPWWPAFSGLFAFAGRLTARPLSCLRPGAQVFLEVALVALVGWAAWLGRGVLGLDVPFGVGVALVGLFSVSLLLLPVGCGRLLLHVHMIGRCRWPRRPACATEWTTGPRVSIHVPCCNEPPALVIATLDRLAAVRYADYEVLIIDNNTRDPDLWRPVEAHCRALGPRFRFFHVEGLVGAKAGALNEVHRHTAEDVELVAVVDADYHVEPDFPGRLVPLFSDPAVGFVQCPHDYRDAADSLFKRACYAEYMPFQKLELPVRAQWGGGFTVGTLCVIRRDAMEAAGMWAPWCLTEDSELAIRIHALGYASFNLGRTFGRGLIPESLVRYRRQRFRWAAGPVQQLRHHWRLLSAWRTRRPGGLDGRQRLLELHHGLEPVQAALAAIVAPSWVLAYGFMLAWGVAPALPDTLLLAVPVTLCGWMLSERVLFGRLGQGWLAVALAFGAHGALRHVTELAGIRALLGRRALRWRRTDKRRPPRRLGRALWDTRQEIGRSAIWLALGAWVLKAASPVPGAGPTMVAILALAMAALYGAAPVIAVLAEVGRFRG